MKTTIIQDKYNTKKTWLVKRYPRGEYYLSQAIDGRKLYPYKRWRKEVIESMIGEIKW